MFEYLAKSVFQEKASSCCIVGTGPLFETNIIFFSIFGVFTQQTVVMQQSERLEIWTGYTLGICI